MPQENLSRHALKGIQKHFAEKAQRLEKKEKQKQRKLRRALEKPRSTHAASAVADDPLFDDSEDLSPAPPKAAAGASGYGVDHAADKVATIIEVRGADALVSSDGRILRARFSPVLLGCSGARSLLAVGDRVRLRLQNTDYARVEEVLPRRSALARGAGDASRREPSMATHVLAANIDQVILVSSAAQPPFRPRLIDRYLVAASRDGLPVVLCVNKVDLGLTDETRAYLSGYRTLGISILFTSAVTGEGLAALRSAVGGKTSLFTGHSGVGKSALLNALEPGLALRVGSVTQATAGQGKGTHTTTSARLAPLSMPDTFIVDSPGIRAFGIVGLAPHEVAAHFPDLARLAGLCVFRNCLHSGEEGCAVSEAAAHSEFLKARWESYRTLLWETQ